MRSKTFTDETPPVQPAFAKTSWWQRARRWVLHERGSQNQSRITFRADTPADIINDGLALLSECAAGDGLVHPIRRHVGSAMVSIHVTGLRNSGHARCSYGSKARAQMHWLRIELGRTSPAPSSGTPQEAGPNLFS